MPVALSPLTPAHFKNSPSILVTHWILLEYHVRAGMSPQCSLCLEGLPLTSGKALWAVQTAMMWKSNRLSRSDGLSILFAPEGQELLSPAAAPSRTAHTAQTAAAAPAYAAPLRLIARLAPAQKRAAAIASPHCTLHPAAASPVSRTLRTKDDVYVACRRR